MFFISSLLGIEHRPFCIITIPKSGTHLAAKLLLLLTKEERLILDYTPAYGKEYDEFEKYLLNLKEQFITCHTYKTDLGYKILRYAKEHPECLFILNIRDLRDVIVSAAHYKGFQWIFESELGENNTLDDRLDHILSLHDSFTKIFTRDCVECAIEEWLDLPNVLIVRFEDLVGEKGGGNNEKQKECILSIANHLLINLNDSQLNHIIDNLFGNSEGLESFATFREGKIGSWKKNFNSHHIELFKQNWTQCQIDLGYSIDDIDSN